VKATGIPVLFEATLEQIQQAGDNTIVFTNFVDFDSVHGHRRDVAGYATALEYFDSRINEVINLLQEDDVLIITADHGCDPTWPGTEHTREHIPVLVYGSKVPAGSLGFRETFADIELLWHVTDGLRKKLPVTLDSSGFRSRGLSLEL
jgi:phosphopentomutase